MPASPSGCSATCVAVGAIMIGYFSLRPSTSDERSTRRGIDRFARNQIDPVERLPVAAKVPFAAVAMRRVVVHRLRDVREHHRLEVERGEHLAEAGRALVRGERTRIELRVQQRRAGHEAGNAGERLAARDRLLPTTFDRSHGPSSFICISYSSSLSWESVREPSRPCDRALSDSACRTCPCSGRAPSAPSR